MRRRFSAPLVLIFRRAVRLLSYLPRWEAGLLSAGALLVAALALGEIGFYAVPTGSMEPVIPRGSLIVVAHVDPSQVKIGDIALVVDRQRGILIAHRVVGKDLERGVLLVKGDAVPGVAEAPFEDFRGVVVFHVPFLGYLFLNRQLVVAAAAFAVALALYLALRW